ncbi:MAG: MCE family protein [Alphaproteobacteria bacterium]|jgi:phospholipid/cholesterol/gamma-HCH transport system substrate-binding protein|nr:MCE family protein [Alphaproteobacteria bacterium]MBF0355029.1 MCE family protein [Alphaproteobacteria bacterium]
MRTLDTNYVAVGAFVLVGVAGLVLALALLTGRTGATDTYYTAYDNVAGIKYGTIVSFEGYPVGQVEWVKPFGQKEQPRFKVALAVREGWEIPEGTVATVASSGLLAAVSIDLKAGKGEAMAKPGALLPGTGGSNVMAAMASLAGDMGDLAETGIKPLLASLLHYVDTLGSTLEKTAPELLSNMQSLSSDLAKKGPAIINHTESLTGRLNKAGEQVLSDKNIGELDNVVRLMGELKSTKAQVDQLMSELNATAVQARPDVAKGLNDLNHTLKVVSSSIDSITTNMESTSRNMAEFSRRIRDNPGLILGGSAAPDEAPR